MLYITTCQHCMNSWRVRDSDKSRVSSIKLRSASYPYPGSNMWTSWPSLSKGQLPASWIGSKQMYSKLLIGSLLRSNEMKEMKSHLSQTKAVFARSLRAKQTTSNHSLYMLKLCDWKPELHDPESPAPISIASPVPFVANLISQGKISHSAILGATQTRMMRHSLCGWYDKVIWHFNDTKERFVAKFKRLEASPIEDFQDFYSKFKFCKKQLLKIFGICSKASCLDHRLRSCTSILWGCLLRASIHRHPIFTTWCTVDLMLSLGFWVEAVSEVADVSPFSKVTWQKDVEWILSGKTMSAMSIPDSLRHGFAVRIFSLGSRLAFFPDLLHPEGTNVISVASAYTSFGKVATVQKSCKCSNLPIQAYSGRKKKTSYGCTYLSLGQNDHLHQASSLPFQRGEVTTTSNARRLLLSQNTWVYGLKHKEFVYQVFHNAPRFHPSLDMFLLPFFFFVELQLLKSSLVKPLSQGWSVVTQRILRHFTEKCNFFKKCIARAQSWIWRSMH